MAPRPCRHVDYIAYDDGSSRKSDYSVVHCAPMGQT